MPARSCWSWLSRLPRRAAGTFAFQPYLHGQQQRQSRRSVPRRASAIFLRGRLALDQGPRNEVSASGRAATHPDSACDDRRFTAHVRLGPWSHPVVPVAAHHATPSWCSKGPGRMATAPCTRSACVSDLASMTHSTSVFYHLGLRIATAHRLQRHVAAPTFETFASGHCTAKVLDHAEPIQQCCPLESAALARVKVQHGVDVPSSTLKSKPRSPSPATCTGGVRCCMPLATHHMMPLAIVAARRMFVTCTRVCVCGMDCAHPCAAGHVCMPRCARSSSWLGSATRALPATKSHERSRGLHPSPRCPPSPHARNT